MSKANRILLVLCLPMFIACIDIMAVSVALNIILKFFKTTVAQTQWLLSAYMIGTAAFLIPIGKLADGIGQRKVLIYGTLLFTFASLVAGVATNMPLLILGRFLQGLATAVIMTVSVSIITHNFPKEERGHAISIWGMALGLGMALGPLVGGVILNSGLSWRWIFLINLPICLIISFLLKIYIPEAKTTSQGKVAWTEVLLLVALLFVIVLILTDGAKLGWLSAMMLGLYVAFVILTVALTYLMRRPNDSLIDMSLFKVPQFTPAILCGFISYFIVYAWLFIISLFLQQNLHFSALHAGLLIAAYSASFAVNAFVTGPLMKRYGNKRVMQLGFAIMVCALILMFYIEYQPTTLLIIVAFAVFAMGVTYVNAPSITATSEYVPVAKAGLVSGIMFTVRWIGGLLGVACVTEIYNFLVMGKYTLLPYICGALAIVSLLGFLVATVFLRSPKPLSS